MVSGVYQNLDNYQNNNSNLLNDRDMLPKHTINTNDDGNKGETRSINIPASILYSSLKYKTLKT